MRPGVAETKQNAVRKGVLAWTMAGAKTFCDRQVAAGRFLIESFRRGLAPSSKSQNSILLRAALAGKRISVAEEILKI